MVSRSRLASLVRSEEMPSGEYAAAQSGIILFAPISCRHRYCFTTCGFVISCSFTLFSDDHVLFLVASMSQFSPYTHILLSCTNTTSYSHTVVQSLSLSSSSFMLLPSLLTPASLSCLVSIFLPFPSCPSSCFVSYCHLRWLPLRLDFGFLLLRFWTFHIPTCPLIEVTISELTHSRIVLPVFCSPPVLQSHP